ncbi:hypothetical protein AB6G58_20720 [Providencia huaxiensis]
MQTEGVGLSTLDYGIFILYVLVIISVGLWVSRDKNGQKKELKIIFWQVKHCLGGLSVHH